MGARDPVANGAIDRTVDGFATPAHVWRDTKGAAIEPRLEVAWASNADEVRAAQQLRYRVFVDEMGARLSPPPGTPQHLDVDRFDAHCEHLVVWACQGSQRQAVGTYRALTPAGAVQA